LFKKHVKIVRENKTQFENKSMDGAAIVLGGLQISAGERTTGDSERVLKNVKLWNNNK
jgi:hypothetical protein